MMCTRMEPRITRRVLLALCGPLAALASSCRDRGGRAGGGETGGAADLGGDETLPPEPPASPAAETGAPAMNDAGPAPRNNVTGPDAAGGTCAPTTPDVIGPFYEAGAPARTLLAAADEPGERLVVAGVVYGPDCESPLADALLDVWQADVDGNYHAAGETDYRLRATLRTDASGRYELETIMPGRYELADGPRPAHIHFQVSAPGVSLLTTQLYFEGDPFLAPNDSCGAGCTSDEPDRIVALTQAQPRRATFDITLAAASG